MRCHYEVLGLERDADDDAIRKAYRKKARTLHPDKNIGNEEEATREFQLVQGAYSVLSDPQERAWYDKHREAIINGGSGLDGEEGVDLMAYFSTTAFDSFDDSPSGFFAVYRQVFKDIVEDEQLVAVYQQDKAIPSFGTSASDPIQEVKPFYSYWDHFTTRRQFHSCDKWDLRDGPDRRVKRLMEKENKKLRAAAKKEYTAIVRKLVAFVKKRDPRYNALKEIIKEQMEEEDRERRIKQAAEEKRIAAERAANQAEVQRQAELLDHMEEGLSKIDQYLDEVYGDAEGDDDDEQQVETHYCAACNKQFKAEKQLRNHENSKKHRQNVAKLRKQMETDAAMFDDMDSMTLHSDTIQDNVPGDDSEHHDADGVSSDEGDVVDDDKHNSTSNSHTLHSPPPSPSHPVDHKQQQHKQHSTQHDSDAETATEMEERDANLEKELAEIRAQHKASETEDPWDDDVGGKKKKKKKKRRKNN